jgi:cytochrome c-type biogenesis protein CcmH
MLLWFVLSLMKGAAAFAVLWPLRTPMFARIRGMVERLAERMARDGSDPEGWPRLVRSYMVLDEPDKARTAVSEARRALAADPAKLRQFEDRLKALGLQG